MNSKYQTSGPKLTKRNVPNEAEAVIIQRVQSKAKNQSPVFTALW